MVLEHNKDRNSVMNRVIRTVFEFTVFLMFSVNIYADTTITTGYDVSEGTYGATTTTTIHYVPVSIKYQESDWNMKITIPWMKMTGSTATVDSSGNVISTSTGTASTISGIGDIVTSYTYLFPAIGQNRSHFLDGTVKLKLPTADETNNLGTGKADLTLQLDYFYSTSGIMPFMTVGYKKFGQPDTYTLNSVWFSSMGAQKGVTKSASIGLIWDYQQATTSTGTHKNEFMAYSSIKLGKKWSSTFYYVTGTTSSSVDNEAGFTLSVKM